MGKEDYFDSAIAWAKKRPFDMMKSMAEGYEDPKSFTRQGTEDSIQPDISFITSAGAKHYIEIALKSEQPQDLVTKWKLLSLMASMKSGKLHLLAPKGHKMFAEKLVKDYNINAKIYSL